MKILYGVSGEGLGHSSRAKEIINHLNKKHKVLVLTYGQALEPLKEFSPIKIPGINLHFGKDNSLSLTKTALKALKSYVKSIPEARKIKNKISSFKPDICITDYEPLTAILSFWYNLPLVSIDNQHRLTHLKIKVPKKYKKYYNLARKMTELCVSKARAFIILSYTKQKTTKNAYLVSPVLRKEIQSLKPLKSNSILVYQTKPSEDLIKILSGMPYKFTAYGKDYENKTINNISYRKISPDFIKELAKAKAVIGTAGFTLISESIYLKKPYFAIPLKGQFEQTLNALFIKQAQLGDYSENPTRTQIENFMKNLSLYEKNLEKQNSNPNEAIQTLDKILEKIENSAPQSPHSWFSKK